MLGCSGGLRRDPGMLNIDRKHHTPASVLHWRGIMKRSFRNAQILFQKLGDEPCTAFILLFILINKVF